MQHQSFLAGLYLITFDTASKHADIAGRLCTTQQAFIPSFAAACALSFAQLLSVSLL